MGEFGLPKGPDKPQTRFVLTTFRIRFLCGRPVITANAYFRERGRERAGGGRGDAWGGVGSYFIIWLLLLLSFVTAANSKSQEFQSFLLLLSWFFFSALASLQTQRNPSVCDPGDVCRKLIFNHVFLLNSLRQKMNQTLPGTTYKMYAVEHLGFFV